METVKVLLAASAAVNAGNSYGNAPIHAALMGGHRAVRAIIPTVAKRKRSLLPSLYGWVWS